MAYTSVIPVRRLDRAVKYVMNKEKTTAVSLQDALDYAANRDKTEQSCFESSYACTLETAFADMRQTKEHWHKLGGVQGYHLVQSFAAGEIAPNWRTKSQRNWQTAYWAGGMNMSSAPT
ncbi:relaxase/mobilization nuclease domain-containing protein [Gemmiger formicilis]|nr:relaxase/mobilization nuclease domain-containing protein [Gemmiger formicilis]